MARGFESKAVESQQEAAANRRPLGPAIDPAVAAQRAERATVALARSRAEADLQAATAAPHRRMLEQAIAELTQRLAALDALDAQG